LLNARYSVLVDSFGSSNDLDVCNLHVSPLATGTLAS
jgi:hypothetical protein